MMIIHGKNRNKWCKPCVKYLLSKYGALTQNKLQILSSFVEY